MRAARVRLGIQLWFKIFRPDHSIESRWRGGFVGILTIEQNDIFVQYWEGADQSSGHDHPGLSPGKGIWIGRFLGVIVYPD